MPKILTGRVISTKMQDTVVVSIATFRKHPIYKKRMRQDRKIKAAAFGMEVKEGDMVKIIQTRPISKEKHFKILEVVK